MGVLHRRGPRLAPGPHGLRHRVDRRHEPDVPDHAAGYVDEQYWESDSGQRYLSLQRRAIAERGVRIRRLFLLDEDLIGREVPASLLAPHRAIGVEIRVLQPAKLDFLLRTDMFDFIVFDGSLSYELRSALTVEHDTRPTIASVTLVADWRVEDRRRRFESMWDVADQPGDQP